MNITELAFTISFAVIAGFMITDILLEFKLSSNIIKSIRQKSGDVGK